MYDFLVDHALRNVWCAPRQDLQSIVQPKKITPRGGVWNKFRLMDHWVTLPVAKTRFHVYQIGQLHPALMGLFPVQSNWMSLSECCTRQKMIVDLYNLKGVQIPRCESWYQITSDRNLIIAVKSQPWIPIALDDEPLYVRVYTNAFFNTERANQAVNTVFVNGRTLQSNNDILALQTQYHQYLARPGATYAFVNGYKTHEISLLTVHPGDVAEFVYDSSVYKVVDFRLGDLNTFDSIKDTRGKYLLHYEGTDSGEIDFHDDIDVYLLYPGTGVQHRGIYYHRNSPDAMRMVTHRDYSVPVDYVVQFIADQPEWLSNNDVIVRLHIRQGGWDRSLIYETNRIHELYKLREEEITQALLGINSTVANWRADTLENAYYVAIMAARSQDIIRDWVETGYGYNTLSTLLGATPSFARVQSSQEVVDVPYGLQQLATAYEYDAAGRLQQWYHHDEGSIYPVENTQTRLVEILAGVASEEIDDTYGQTTQTLNPDASYRMYVCGKVNGVPDGLWRDVTGGGEYAVINNQLTWLVSSVDFHTLVRGDTKHLAYSVTLDVEDGVLRLSLTQQLAGNRRVMQVPMGALDLFLNNRSLIEDIDYHVEFPEVVIFNKEYLINPPQSVQRVTVRFSGFCQSDLTRERLDDKGFVHYGQLSRNNKYDLRDDKVLRIVVEGELLDRSDLKFAEDDIAVQVDARNGAPYLIRDIVVPTRGRTNRDTYDLRAEALVIDEAVSDYMTMRSPQPVPDFPSPIQNRYQVYSPFCANLIYDLKNGILDDPRLYEHYNDSDVADICGPYLELLRFDPTQDDNEIDERFVVIHPHNLDTVIQLDIYHYKFVDRAVKLYLNNKVQLSGFVSIQSV